MDRKNLQRAIACCAVLLVFFLYVFFSLEKIHCFDVWWHLASGKWMFKHHSIVTHDPFSFTHYKEKWYNTAWLFQALIYQIYIYWGFAGLAVFKAFVVVLFFLALWQIARLKKSHWILFVFLSLIVLFTAKGRFFVRPHILSYFYIALALLLLEIYRTKRKIIWLTPLIPLEILWVNTHGSFILGPVFIGAYMLPLILKGKKREFFHLAGLWILIVLSSFINPFGPVIYKIPLKHETMRATTILISEWKRYKISSLFNFSDQPLTKIGFFLFLLGALLSLRLEAISISLFGAYLMFSHVRFIPIFFMFSYPYALEGLERFSTKKKVISALLLSLFALSFISFYDSIKRFNFGIGYDRERYPDALCTFIKKMKIKGNVFNLYGYGGFIIWNNWPDIKVFIDGRTPTLHTGRDFLLFDRALNNPKTFWRLVWQYKITSVLIKREHKLVKYLMDDPYWTLACFDEKSVLLLRKEAFEKILSKYGISELSMDFKPEKLELDKVKYLVPKIENYDRIYPHSAYYKSLLGIFYSRLDHKEKAIRMFKEALSLIKKDPYLYYDIGLLYLDLNRAKEAKFYLEKAVKLKSKIPIYWYKLADAYYEMGKLKDALRCYEKYGRLAVGSVDTELFYKMGLVCYKLKNFKDALYYFRLAIYTSENLAGVYYNLGNTYFMLHNYKMAEWAYLHSLKLKEDNENLLFNLSKTYEALGDKKKAIYYMKKFKLKEKTKGKNSSFDKKS